MGFLRVEGVDFDRTVFDTQDLSTIRGTSFAYGQVLAALDALLARDHEAERVSLGSSTGLWQVAEATSLETPVTQMLRNADGLPPVARHLAFVVVSADDETYTPTLRIRLVNASRRKQLMDPWLPPVQLTPAERALPDVTGIEAANGDLVANRHTCTLNLVRPHNGVPERIKGDWALVSQSVSDRRRIGVAQKQAFYSDQVGPRAPDWAKAHDKLPFALHFETLTDIGGRHTCADKIAVLYLDGNKFSELEAEISVDEDGARRFDERLDAFRARLVARILEILEAGQGLGPPSDDEADERRALSARDGKAYETDRVARIEILMFGGDDMMVVLPARLGWTALRALHELERNFDGDGIPFDIDGIRVSHSAGLVFCHHNAPIHRIKLLAESLMRDAKAVGTAGDGHSRTAFAVMESFDTSGGDSAEYWQARAPGALAGTLILDERGAKAIADAIAVLKRTRDGFPLRRLHRLALAIHRYFAVDPQAAGFRRLKPAERAEALALRWPDEDQPDDVGAHALRDALARAERDWDPELGEIRAKTEAAGIDWAASWLLTEELWDYVEVLFETGGGDA